MDEAMQQALKNVDRAEDELEHLTQAQNSQYAAMKSALDSFRSTCQDALFLDLKLAADHNVEPRIWQAHHTVNNRLRKSLKDVRKESRKVVERRKLEKVYLNFIKSSLRFYRTFLQRIWSHFTGIGELHSVAQKMHLDLLSVDAPVPVDAPQKQQLLQYCHSTLIHCGDLSRYREIALAQKTRNWGPAEGYYECAARLDPTSGLSFNQLSMMAVVDDDDFGALYYTYMCLATINPFPAADENLIRLLNKIWTKTKKPSATQTKPARAEFSFLYFHAMIHADADAAPADFRPKRDTLLGRGGLFDLVVSEPGAKSLKQMCLMNIAAFHHATKVLQSAEQIAGSHDRESRIYHMLLELNMSTLALFMSIVSLEHENVPQSTPQFLGGLASTSTIHKLLPCLRLYSAWLMSNIDILRERTGDGIANKLPLESLWTVFLNCKAALSEKLSTADIDNVRYLLEEDQGMLHFSPIAAVVQQAMLRKPGEVAKSVRRDEAIIDKQT
ncbi:Protein SMG7 [Cyphellophora attinorum]|uniref:Protein SMG7 n=1 Tax=Cyphellophora attinorum TaxID=1664694 RepID=A0A0N0NH90_9EURO|nr:Protein SMG7 [Phialophora attinorum]KPI34411.1 Protein SMG7 [Phialophora attinorum]